MDYRIYRSRKRAPRLALLSVLGALLVAGFIGGATMARAQDPSEPEPTITGPARVAAGVTIGGVDVGGMPRRQAVAAVELSFGRPLEVGFYGDWTRTPASLGATADVDAAVSRALDAKAGSNVILPVSVNMARLRAAVDKMALRRDRPARDATVALRGLRPVIKRARQGYAVRRAELARTLRRQLLDQERTPMAAPYRLLHPTIQSRDIGVVIVIHRGSNELHLFRRERPWRVFGVASGQARYPTPLGSFSIASMQRHPWWFPPASDWAQGLKPVPPGPGNPLGTRWMGLTVSGVGIHGTPDAASIGYSASHGCIRMRIPDAEWLFDHVQVGTPVFVVSA